MLKESIHIEKLTTIQQFRQGEELQGRVWGMSDTDVVPLHLLLTAQKNGGLVLGAFDEEGRMIGLLFGFLGARDATARQLKHCSHMMGVLEEWRGQEVGYRLKLAQREHALAQGLELVTWTYDPLESLNAALNIGKLGVVCRTYFRDLYGEMEGGLNVGLSTDRFQVEWWIASQRVVHRLAAPPASPPTLGGKEGGQGYRPSLDAALESGAQLLNPATAGPNGLVRPSPASLKPTAETVLVEIPAHVQAIKAADIELARQWRAQTRELFERCFAAGYTVTEFISEVRDNLRRSYYVLQRDFEVL
jgi:predicted GNAT superfamily acetyltransferase